MYFFLMYNLSTKAHKGPQQPTKADAGPQRWKMPNRSFFFNNVFLKIYNLFIKAHEGPQVTAANEGQCRPGLNIIIDLPTVDVYKYLNLRTCMQAVGVPMVYPYPLYPWLTEPEGRRVRVLTGTGTGQPGITRGLPGGYPGVTR